jgi:hypothetical protein
LSINFAAVHAGRSAMRMRDRVKAVFRVIGYCSYQ